MTITGWPHTYGLETTYWVAYFHFVGWSHLSLGVHFCLSAPNMEIHMPFGFIRVGRRKLNGWWKLRRTCS